MGENILTEGAGQNPIVQGPLPSPSGSVGEHLVSTAGLVFLNGTKPPPKACSPPRTKCSERRERSEELLGWEASQNVSGD